MEAIRNVTGVAAPVMAPNTSTDILIPSREITSASREGYGPKLFAAWRYNPDGSENTAFVLNRPPWRESRILIAGENFGCGSSREMAVWALVQFGIRCIVAPSYAPIFRENCLRNGLLPVVLPQAEVEKLGVHAQSSPRGWTVDLESCSVTMPEGAQLAFEIDAREREQLLQGLDPIGVTMRQAPAIAAFIAADRRSRPWIWG